MDSGLIPADAGSTHNELRAINNGTGSSPLTRGALMVGASWLLGGGSSPLTRGAPYGLTPEQLVTVAHPR